MSLPAKPVENFFLGAYLPNKPDDGAPVVVGKAYDFALWLLPKVETFPRSHRFTIGERLSAQGLDVLLILTEAAYTSGKEASVYYLLKIGRDGECCGDEASP